MAKIFKETGDPNEKYLRYPFDKNAVLAADKPGGPKLLWFNDDQQPSWQPYCIHIVELNGRTLKFYFVMSDEGGGAKDVGNPRTVDLDRLQDVWPDFPSTINQKLVGAPPAGQEYALLFLSKAYAAATPEAGNSGGTESKWPKGSEWFALVRKLCKVAPQAPHTFTEEERALLKIAGAEWL